MDIEILKWVHETFHDITWLNAVMQYVTLFGEFGLGPILCGLILIFLPKTRSAGHAVAFALILNLIIVNLTLKKIIDRPRPWQEFPELEHICIALRLPSDASFPSGHTAACFAFAVALTCRYKLKALPVLILAFLVGISRIYLCVHFPTDVLGGLTVGSLCGVTGYFISKGMYSLLEKKRPRSYEIDPFEGLMEPIFLANAETAVSDTDNTNE